MKRLGFMLLIVFTCLTAAWAGSRIVYVPAPNGTDDTANIQAALNACLKYGPGCTVQLQAGTYHTKQVLAYNFSGTFKGMGMNRTTIEALFLTVTWAPDVEACQPTTCLWPTLITFVNGNIGVSDFTINVPLVPSTQPWVYTGITMDGVGPLEFTGQSANVTIDRIAVNGMPDESNYWGYNIINAVHYSGELPRSSTIGDVYCLSGSYTVRNSYFNNTTVPISQDSCVTSSKITIGGAPGAGNYTQNDWGGIDLEGSENSFFEVSYNNSSGFQGGWVVPSYYVASGPSWYSIHDNTFIATGSGVIDDYWPDGFYLYDSATNPWIKAAVWNNTVQLPGTLQEGIGAYYTTGTAIWNNSVTGTDEYDGIGLWSSTGSSVVGNNLRKMTIDPAALAKIYLDPYTTKDFVLCSNFSDMVLNQGTNNIVIGCQQETATSARTTESETPAVAKPKAGLPKGKPWLQ